MQQLPSELSNTEFEPYKQSNVWAITSEPTLATHMFVTNKHNKEHTLNNNNGSRAMPEHVFHDYAAAST